MSFRNRLPNWTKTETAYIAGIVDGEGCIGIYRRWNRGYFIQITITNTDKTLLSWLSRKLRANAVKALNDKRPNNRATFSVTVDRVRAFDVLQRIQPYLKVKARQAKLAIRFKRWQDAHKTDRTGYGHRAYGDQEKRTCEKFVGESRLLNLRGAD